MNTDREQLRRLGDSIAPQWCPEFDLSERSRFTVDQIKPGDTLIVGCDTARDGGYSATVTGIERDGVLYIINMDVSRDDQAATP